MPRLFQPRHRLHRGLCPLFPAEHHQSRSMDICAGHDNTVSIENVAARKLYVLIASIIVELSCWLECYPLTKNLDQKVTV